MRLLALTFASLATSLAASDFRLSFPVDCTLGQDCFLQNYVDHQPGEGVSDFRCNRLTYDGHKGTDIALYSHDDLARDVAVFATAPGLVLGQRNTMRDRFITGPDSSDIEGRECGNGVVLRHDDGWETQYCHLKQGSVTVKKGDHVKTGQILGHIGASGKTAFPHLHLSVRKDGKVVDPFAPEELQSCGDNPLQLWEDPIDYVEGGLIATAIDSLVPEYVDIKESQARPTVWATDTPALVAWTFGFGLQPHDEIILSITGESGQVIQETILADRYRAQFFYARGRRAPSKGWQPGPYRARAVHKRVDRILSDQSFDFTIE